MYLLCSVCVNRKLIQSLKGDAGICPTGASSVVHLSSKGPVLVPGFCLSGFILTVCTVTGTDQQTRAHESNYRDAYSLIKDDFRCVYYTSARQCLECIIYYYTFYLLYFVSFIIFCYVIVFYLD